jgi:aspartyl aminopeptidase
MHDDGKQEARDLATYIDASPSPFHACLGAAERLEAQGFAELSESAAWKAGAGRHFVRRGGSLVAWVVPDDATPATPFRVVGAHTDSPNLRVKPRPDSERAGVRQLGVEIYGGALLNSWLNRDLGLSGRAWVRGEGGPEERLFRVDRPLLTVPQLAIHLHREVTSEGLKLNPQEHLAPVWALADTRVTTFAGFLADTLGVEPDAVLAWDAMCHDLRESHLLGAREDFLAAPRLDNLCSSFCALQGLLAVLERPLACVPVVTLFDHEEVGSVSSRGAQSPLLPDVLERTVLARGGGREDYHRAVSGSVCVSADMAHATHPNYVQKHEPEHHVRINGGPVVKVNANQRYASESETEAVFQEACERADVPFQKWVNRTDLACGSTIGPLTASNLGMRTVDIGNAQLSMHSARELCGSLDPGFLVRALTAFWS